MFVVGFDYKTGMEKALFTIIQGKSLPGNTNFHWDYKSRSGLQCAEFKPQVVFVPQTQCWEYEAELSDSGGISRCPVS